VAACVPYMRSEPADNKNADVDTAACSYRSHVEEVLVLLLDIEVVLAGVEVKGV
jgi:hypothetical protein